MNNFETQYTDDFSIHLAARQSLENLTVKFTDALNECAEQLRTLEKFASHRAVIESIRAAAEAIEGDYRGDCLDILGRVITDELSTERHIENQIEDDENDASGAADFRYEQRRDDEMMREMGCE